MTSAYLWTIIATAVAILAAVLWQYRSQKPTQIEDDNVQVDFELSDLAKELAEKFPDQVTLATSASIAEYRRSYYAKQSSYIVPGCVVRPRDADQLREVVNVLRSEYHEQKKQYGSVKEGIFTIRSGGHSILDSTMHGGIVIDMTAFTEITVSKDQKSVRLGAGNVWGDVNRALESQDLYVAGGRDINVGVGGLVTGGKYPCLVTTLNTVSC